jgi:tellurite resistance protein TehA-like permease
MWGAMAAASWVVGLIFLRHWKLTRDRLFAMFAIAFWIMGISWTALAIENPPRETQHYFYLLRLIAFLVILAAIIDKNRAPRESTVRR